MKKALSGEMIALGIMNGTSLDGVDFVQVKISFTQKSILKIQFINEQAFRFSTSLRKELAKATEQLLKVDELSRLHHDLGRFYVKCFKKLPASMRKSAVIGLHGQTVFHEAPRATLQIGEASYLAAHAKVPVVADFRVADLALGGQGAPIATLFHHLTFAKNKKVVAVHNLGGISNLSLLAQQKVLQSFDTGPANMLIDMCVKKKTRNKKHFDLQGAGARAGHIDASLLKTMLQHPYFKKKAPKSCGREEFGERFYKQIFKKLKALSYEDQLATLTELTAASVAEAYMKLVQRQPEEIIFCGGGAKNIYLIERIQSHLPKMKILTCEDYGWPSSSIEGAAFATLAFYKLMKWPSNFPQTTGARRATSLGKVVEVN